MKKIYRRSISGLMALLICFTTILGGGITAFAASSSGITSDDVHDVVGRQAVNLVLDVFCHT